MLVLQIKFDDKIVMLIYTIFHKVTCILTLIGSLTCCKEAKTLRACYLISVNFKMVFFQYHVTGTCSNCLIEAIPTCTDNVFSMD